MTNTPSLFETPPDESTTESPQLLYLTNRVNILEVLARQLLVARASYDDERYFTDLLDSCPGRIPLLAGPPDTGLLSHVQSGGASSFPVILELDPKRLSATDVPAMANDGTTARGSLGASSFKVWAPSAPVPLAACLALHFRTSTELDEHRLRRYDNVPDALELKVSPAFFEGGPEPHAVVPWLQGLASVESGDLDIADRIGGALVMVAAALPSGEPSMTLLRDLLTVRRTGRRPKASPAAFARWLVAVSAGARKGADFNEAMTAAIAPILATQRPAAQWRPSEVLEAIKVRLAAGRLPKHDAVELDQAFEYIHGVLRNDIEFKPFRSDAKLPVARALLLTLMRSEPIDFLEWAETDTGADHEVRVTAAAFCGLLHGRSRLPTRVRPPVLDDYLARLEAAAAAADADSVLIPPEAVKLESRDSLVRLRVPKAREPLLERPLAEAPSSVRVATEAVLADPVFVEAMTFAIAAHEHQPRKGTTYPYVVHPMRVGEILLRHGCDASVIVAGILHDTLEDTKTDRPSLAAKFGERVAGLVEAVSEPSKLLGEERTREERMQQTIDHLGEARDIDVLRIAAADKLDNVRSIRDTIAERGLDATFALFNAPREAQSRYYRVVSDTLVGRHPEEQLFQLLQLEVQSVFPAPGDIAAARFFFAQPLVAAEQARPYLADAKVQWKKGRSAYELAHHWIDAGGLPASVRRTLETDDAFEGCEVAEGFFERQVGLRTPGRPSQTDLLVLLRLRTGHAVVAVEGKAGESFDKTVTAWNDSDGKQRRLESLCDTLGVDLADAGVLRYQLLHRTASAIYEAERYGVVKAVMLVHAFAVDKKSFADFQSFAKALKIDVAEMGRLSPQRNLNGLELQLAWVQEGAQTGGGAAT